MKLSIFTLLMCAFAVSCIGSKSGIPLLTEPFEQRTVFDDLGRQITVPKEINRIVSLAPSVTEMLYTVGAGERLVGVTTFCNYPEQALEVAKVGDTMNPNLETIIALKPDIVMVSTASQIETFTKTLQSNGISMYVIDPKSLSDVTTSLNKLAALFDTITKAAQKIQDLESRRKKFEVLALQGTETSAELTDRVKPVRVFVQISKEPLFTIGNGAFVTNIVANAGGISVTSEIESAYPKISKETAAAYKPDAIILSDSEDNREPNDVFKNSPAVKNGRVLKVNADILSRPGPRLIDAMEQIAKFLHPEKVK